MDRFGQLAAPLDDPPPEPMILIPFTGHSAAMPDGLFFRVLSGHGTFWLENESNCARFGPGELLFFKRGTVHALPTILEDPVVFLAIDTPRRNPADIIFVNPGDGTPETFIKAD